jgi:hypothetical protein
LSLCNFFSKLLSVGNAQREVIKGIQCVRDLKKDKQILNSK